VREEDEYDDADDGKLASMVIFASKFHYISILGHKSSNIAVINAYVLSSASPQNMKNM
jgi:hypothetical protein